MKKIIILLAQIMLIVPVTLSISPARVYADELITVESIQETTGSGPITKIDPPEKTEYSFETEMILDELSGYLPKELTVWHGDESSTIDITWKCEKDYDEDLDEYPFVPDLEGYDLAEGAEIPRITVSFENKWQTSPSGDIDIGDIRIPKPEESDTADRCSNLPASYNVYEMGKLPKVRNQGNWGTCWAHAVIAAVEADLIHDGKADTSIDLSELHMAYYPFNSYEDPVNARKDNVTNKGEKYWLDVGGNMYTGMHLLSNLVGTIQESDAPYTPKTLPDFHPTADYITSKDVYQLDSASYYSTSDREGIKKAIMDHGAVVSSYYHANEYYSKTYNSYYDPGKIADGHQIAIVGWNDDFSRQDFAGEKPSGDGAWLIRNSWGENKYGMSGYFWISYYDWGLLRKGWALALDAKKRAYENCYAYDGIVNDNGFLEFGSPAVQKTSYTVAGGEAVKAVGIEIGTADSSVEVTVKNMATGMSSEGSKNCSRIGFYTVKLNEPLVVPREAEVEVTVKYVNKDGKVSIAYEYPINGEDDEGIFYTTKCDKGFAVDGKSIKHDPRVKLFTGKAKMVKSVSLNKSKLTLYKGKTATLAATVKPTGATNRNVKWISSNKKIATVTQKGLVKGLKSGTVTITAKARDGSGNKAVCKVTVKVKVKSVSITYNKKTVSRKTIKKGKKLQLKAKITPSDATNKEVTWKSSKKSVATVNSKGLVTAKKAGNATITVTTKDGKKTAKCKITVKKK